MKENTHRFQRFEKKAQLNERMTKKIEEIKYEIERLLSKS